MVAEQDGRPGLSRARRLGGHRARPWRGRRGPSGRPVLSLGALLRSARAVRAAESLRSRPRPRRSATPARSLTWTARSGACSRRSGPGRRIVAAVGDHGEMLGEHGEKEHGIFVYRGALEVPLILSGPGVPSGRVVDGPACDAGPGRRRFSRSPASALRPDRSAPSLPGVRASAVSSTGARVQRVRHARHRLRVEPARGRHRRPVSLHRRAAVPSSTTSRRTRPRSETSGARRRCAQTAEEAQRVIVEERVREERMRRPGCRGGGRLAPAARLSLGLERARARSDPKDGILLLDEFEKAKDLTRSGRATEAIAALTVLVKASPGNVPFSCGWPKPRRPRERSAPRSRLSATRSR